MREYQRVPKTRASMSTPCANVSIAHAREQLGNLAKTWLKLAGDLQALRDKVEEPESRRRTG
jgi:hypothetical protein